MMDLVRDGYKEGQFFNSPPSCNCSFHSVFEHGSIVLCPLSTMPIVRSCSEHAGGRVPMRLSIARLSLRALLQLPAMSVSRLSLAATDAQGAARLIGPWDQAALDDSSQGPFHTAASSCRQPVPSSSGWC